MSELVFTRMPCDGPITGRFGDTGAAYPSPHRGVDIGCPVGTVVYAPAGGKIVAFTNDGSFGTGVCIDHPDTPWYSLYAHLEQARVLVGDVVAGGQPIGLSGATGRVTGPHLHWQVCKSSAFPPDIEQSADPLSFLRTQQLPQAALNGSAPRGEVAAAFERLAEAFMAEARRLRGN